MIPNAIKQRWAEGKPILNSWLAIPNSFSAEVMAHCGWDSVTVDMQHGMVDYQAAVTMLQAIKTAGLPSLVRVPWLEPGIVMKCLDAGAYGVVCPMVNNRADAERLVSYMHYPPKGERSFGPTRALISAGADYAARASDEIISLAMVETAEGFANVEEICATPGLDGIYIGPADLSLALGFPPGVDPTEPKVVDAIAHIAETAHRHGKKVGLHTGSPDYAAAMVKKGFDFVTISNDVRLLASMAAQQVKAFRDAVGERAEEAAKASGGY